MSNKWVPPAFPNGRDVTNGQYEPHGGLTQRQYYKAKALAGLMANPNVVGLNLVAGWALQKSDSEDVAEFCGNLADAMIAEDAKHAS